MQAKPVDDASFRDILGRFATGTTIVTVQYARGKVTGLTASAFCSLSLRPPLILLCVDYNAVAYPALRDVGAFAVHILASDQRDLALQFAQEVLDKTEILDWDFSSRGNPLLRRYLGVLECRLTKEHSGGDHAILLGEVEAVQVDSALNEPLIYYRGELLAPLIDE